MRAADSAKLDQSQAETADSIMTDSRNSCVASRSRRRSYVELYEKHVLLSMAGKRRDPDASRSQVASQFLAGRRVQRLRNKHLGR